VRFQLAHKLVTYLLALSAVATLATTGLVPGTTLGLFALLAAVSWRDAPAKLALFDRMLPLTRALMGAFLVYTAWVLARQLPEPDLYPVLAFVLTALGVKLSYRRGHRDDVHVFVLSFLLVLAASALGGGALFAPAFVVYVVAATWALLLFHLRREMEENYLVKHSAQAPSQKVGVARILNSRRIVGGPFFASTGAVGLAIVGGAVATFALVPRVGAGLVFGARRAPNAIGFSDEVSLGRYGTLAHDAGAVALRASVPRVAALPTPAARAAAADGLYWRGSVYDAYEDGRWTRSRTHALRTGLAAHDRTVVVEGEPSSAPAATLERQEIDVVGLTVPVAFALDRPVAFEAPAPPPGASFGLQLAARWSGELALRLAPAGAPALEDAHAEHGDADGSRELRAPVGLHYVAYSTDAPRDEAAELPPEARAAYLQLPPALAPRLVSLAARIAPAGPPAATARALAEWLRATHTYSLELPRPAPGLDPVESFLVETPAGHCEYFASAMALLLRARGVPARYVNGYLGGEWNDVGRYVAVRDGRAHSWVEAYLPDAGWTRVDATPPLPAARAGRVRQWLDSLDFAWARWIVSYDLPRQLELARGVAERLGLHAPGAPGGRAPTILVVLAAVVAMAIAATRLAPGRATARPAPRAANAADGAPVTKLYARALARLAQAGVPRARGETPREYARRIGDAGLDDEAALAELTELYTAARFGGRGPAAEALHALGPRVARLGRAVRATAA
jgi:transglutaminase-like putative cysteine protease